MESKEIYELIKKYDTNNGNMLIDAYYTKYLEEDMLPQMSRSEIVSFMINDIKGINEVLKYLPNL